MRKKEKLLVTSNFSFSHNIFHSFKPLVPQNVLLYGNGSKTLGKKAFKNIVGKGENAGFSAISPIPTIFSTFPNTNFNFSLSFILSSANPFYCTGLKFCPTTDYFLTQTAPLRHGKLSSRKDSLNRCIKSPVHIAKLNECETSCYWILFCCLFNVKNTTFNACMVQPFKI